MGSTVVFDLPYSAFDVPLETSSRDVFFSCVVFGCIVKVRPPRHD